MWVYVLLKTFPLLLILQEAGVLLLSLKTLVTDTLILIVIDIGREFNARVKQLIFTDAMH